MLQSVDDARRIVEQIRDEHHQPPLVERVSELVKRPRRIGLRAGLETVQRQEQRPQMPGSGARRSEAEHFVVERHEACGVALAVHEIRQRCRETRSIFQLGHGAGAIAHGRADVEQEMRAQIGLFFETLHIVAVGAREYFPVHRGQIVPWQVLAVFGELDTEALERTAMQPRQEAFHDRPRAQLQSGDARQHRRIEKPLLAPRVAHVTRPVRSSAAAPPRSVWRRCLPRSSAPIRHRSS